MQFNHNTPDHLCSQIICVQTLRSQLKCLHGRSVYLTDWQRQSQYKRQDDEESWDVRSWLCLWEERWEHQTLDTLTADCSTELSTSHDERHYDTMIMQHNIFPELCRFVNKEKYIKQDNVDHLHQSSIQNFNQKLIWMHMCLTDLIILVYYQAVIISY